MSPFWCRFAIYLVRSAGFVCLFTCEKDVNIERKQREERDAKVGMNDGVTEIVSESVCSCMCVLSIPHIDRTPTATHLLCKQTHHTSPVLWTAMYLSMDQEGPKFCRRCRLRKKKLFLGPADLLLCFNWVVKSNIELFQECQNVIPPVCLQEEPSLQGHRQILSERK